MSDDPLLWLNIVLILLLGGFFSLTETAFAATNSIRLEVLAETSRPAKKALYYLKRFEQSVIITVIGSNIVSVTLSAMATILFSSFFNDLSLASLAATLAASILFYVFCDTIPKSIARAVPTQIVILTSSFLAFFEIIFFPLILIFSQVKALLNKFVKTPNEPDITEDDFSTIVEQQIAAGTLEEEEEELIQSVIDFSDTAVKDVLTPLEKIYAIDEKLLHDPQVSQYLFASPFSRIPIYRDSMQHVVGIISIRTYAQSYKKNKSFMIEKIIKKPYFVSSKVTIDDLFEGFKKQRTHIAIVLGNQQEVIGMVTMEDVLEEVVGQMDSLSKGQG
jgi:putative hemolysin